VKSVHLPCCLGRKVLNACVVALWAAKIWQMGLAEIRQAAACRKLWLEAAGRSASKNEDRRGRASLSPPWEWLERESRKGIAGRDGDAGGP
jgi:hypothetical protein